VAGPLGPVSPFGQELSVKPVSPLGKGSETATIITTPQTPLASPYRGPGALNAAPGHVRELARVDQPQRPGLQAPGTPIRPRPAQLRDRPVAVVTQMNTWQPLLIR